jgi:hypothetical protein
MAGNKIYIAQMLLVPAANTGNAYWRELKLE